MSSVPHLQDFIRDRLTAAAAEIFSEFEQTILRYEEELDRQRRLLDSSSWKPEVKLHRVDLQQEPVHKTRTLKDQQLCKQERNTSLDQEEPEPSQFEDQEEPEPPQFEDQEEPEPPQFEEPEPPQIKVEEQDLCTKPDEDQLHLKQETDLFMVTILNDESESEPDREQHISQSSAGPEDQDQDSGLIEITDWSPTKTDDLYGNQAGPSATSDKLFSCKICGETFLENLLLIRHIKVHKVWNQNSDKLLYCCPTCGKHFSSSSKLVTHVRIHTGEKPYSCGVCGKTFNYNYTLKSHMRIHTGEKSYSCRICGTMFSTKGSCTVHMRRHTGEKPFSCNFCGKTFTINGDCKRHMMIHTGEKPFFCKICGKTFNRTSHLNRHMKSHTGGEKFHQMI